MHKVRGIRITSAEGLWYLTLLRVKACLASRFCVDDDVEVRVFEFFRSEDLGDNTSQVTFFDFDNLAAILHDDVVMLDICEFIDSRTPIKNAFGHQTIGREICK